MAADDGNLILAGIIFAGLVIWLAWRPKSLVLVALLAGVVATVVATYGIVRMLCSETVRLSDRTTCK